MDFILFFKYNIVSNIIFSIISDIIYNEIGDIDTLYIILCRIKDEAFSDYKIFYEFIMKRQDIFNTFEK